ncbi:TonB-dependent receptor [Croceicoccus naphthovorans]|uniref:TonB-dependent receptor n=1 Tax=Croceicoccus naphthovorans TaxID=1348774 RepID=A0A0G3XJ41_9SPHN|nr:TonB-dependent receptor [Croceicoccus naphthovorans]AKM11580.1 TonB-dependent receptor [Croceicoccus naphthovorans]MBB3989623.1 outer membrane receptor protein involved in Fe transport [Croceicoccus naphthovorans]
MLKLSYGASVGALAVAIAGPAVAQEAVAPRQGGLNEIVVTATKRTESLQDVAISVNALGEDELDNLGVDTFGDYLDQLPSVTAGASGPGQSTIYIRGLASTTPNLTTAGVAGLAPNVALYLDEQPLAQPGRNLDVYAADLERIEVLGGPQGTLFGASSQAGVVRLITNKPSLSGFAAKAKAETSFTKGGETSYKGELMLNMPVTDRIALRGVVFLDDQGGYIDNVQGTRSMRDSARFREEGTVRYNGVPVSSGRAGFQSSPEDLAYIDSEVTFIEADNARLVEDNFNDTQYAGFRASALFEVNNDWTVTVSHMRQSLESDGVFFADPELDGLDDLEIQRFSDDRLEDDFSNTSWTVEGRIGALELLYTGAYTDRETQQNVGYSDYLFVGQYIPYYMCDTAVAYPGSVDVAPADPTCYAPNLSVSSNSDTTVFTQELRFSTPQDLRVRATVGGFYSDLTLKERNDYFYASEMVRGADGVTRGFAPIYPFTNTEVTGTTGRAFPGYFSDPGPLPEGAGFRNDVKRTDKQWGIFGEASFDIVPDVLTITGGARYYDVEVDLEGAATSAFCKLNSPIFGANAGVPVEDQVNIPGCGGGNLSLLYGPDNEFGNPDKATASGVIFKGTLTFTPTEDLLFYATYSEGFRPGLLNRPGGTQGPGDYVVPYELETDEVTNYEIGWKTELMDRQLRLNGSAFYVDISRLQTSIFDPNIVNLVYSDNAADARIYGVEGDFTVAPYAAPGLTVTGAFSFLDTKITEVLIPTNDVIEGESLAYAPEFQGNLRVRYEWDLSDSLTAHIMPQVNHSGSKYTDIIEINKLKLDSYTTFSMTAGVTADMWSAELFGENLTDTRAEVAGNFNFDVPRITTNRPLTVGLRVKFDY